MIILDFKFKLKVYEVIEEIVDHGNVDTVVILQRLDMHTEKLSLGNIIKINEKMIVTKDENVPEEVTLAKTSH